MIGLVAFLFSSCQSESAQNGNAIMATPNGVPSASSNATPAGQRPEKNPAHGMPFHDCALPVGAALTAESQPVQNQGTTPPVNMAPQASPENTNNTNGVKLNPAHGVPDHRCELPVGAPLA